MLPLTPWSQVEQMVLEPMSPGFQSGALPSKLLFLISGGCLAFRKSAPSTHRCQRCSGCRRCREHEYLAKVKSPPEESNLVFRFRRPACDPAHPKPISSPPRNRTPSSGSEDQRASPAHSRAISLDSWNRTSGLVVPNHALCLAELHPDVVRVIDGGRTRASTVTVWCASATPRPP